MFQMLIMNLYRDVRKVARQISFGKLLLAFIPYILYLLVFSFNQQLSHLTHVDKIVHPNYSILSKIEYTLFFCYPHKLLSSLANPVFDFLAAIPYVFHFVLPFAFSLYLVLSNEKREALYPFVWCAGWVNLVAVVVQVLFPTAPPWFTDSAVFDEDHDLVYEYAVEGGFHRLDRLMGRDLFCALYSQSPLKFGAFPSLHVAWPMVVLVNHPWVGTKFALCHVVWIIFAALYITHHYLIDAVAGVVLVLVVRYSMLKLCSPFPELEVLKKKPTKLKQANHTESTVIEV